MAKENKEMEKKVTSSPARLTSCETKGKENGRNTGNKTQRYAKGKRDQPQGRSNPPDPSNGQSRRPVPQKSRAMDKRPRSRGLPASRRDEVTVDQRAEFGSALPHGPKKINLNHLINFTLSPRDSDDARGAGNWRGRSRWGRHPRFNKEQFLQANCQFVVKASGTYKQQSVDPDTLVDWDLIEQVRMLGHEMPSCPICLYPPAAAKITKCGHIFCWPCILHYVSLGDKKWRKCPICYDSVMADDLKSVIAKSLQTFSVGDTVTMRLMKREKGSVVIQPHFPDQPPAEAALSPHASDDPNKTCFAKLMVATPHEVKNVILMREKRELEQQFNESCDDLEKSFIQNALDSLKEREESLGTTLDAAPSFPHMAIGRDKKSSTDDSQIIEEGFTHPASSSSQNCIVYASAFSDEEEIDEAPDIQGEKDAQEKPPPSQDVPGDTLASQAEIPTDAKEGENTEGDAGQDTEEDLNTGDNTRHDAEHNTNEKTQEAESATPRDEGAVPDISTKSDEKEEEGMKGQGTGKTDVKEEESSPTKTALASGRERRTSAGQGSAVYFYQAEDGQHMYLGSLNARCLMHEYGGLEFSPLTITARLVEIEHISVTQELRNRLRHLHHLPLTCEVCICELDLRPPAVSHKTLAHFSADIQKKKQKRDKKAREEKKRERKIQQEEDRKSGIYPKPRFSLKSTNQFPSFTPGPGATENPGTLPPRPISPASVDSAASSTYSAALSSDGYDEEVMYASYVDSGTSPVHVSAAGGQGGAAGGAWPSLSSPENQGGQRSFAQMLRQGVARPVSGTKSPHSSTPQHYAASSSHRKTPTSSNESDNEDYVPVPQYKDAFSNAIQDALDKAAVASFIKKEEADTGASPTGSGSGGGGGRKNKKGRKKQLLFSTAGPRFK